MCLLGELPFGADIPVCRFRRNACPSAKSLRTRGFTLTDTRPGDFKQAEEENRWERGRNFDMLLPWVELWDGQIGNILPFILSLV